MVGCDVSVAAAQATVGLVRGAGGPMVSMERCQLTDPADCQALVDLPLGTFGRVDVLFNLAGLEYFKWLENISDTERDRAWRDEVDLVFYRTRAAWPHLKASGGVMVNMGPSTPRSASRSSTRWPVRRTRRGSSP